MKEIKSIDELNVFRLAMRAAGEVFDVSKRFPEEEKYSLTSQIRRSSRSVCLNLAESWRKRQYGAAFKAKISDALSEASETATSVSIARHCGYLSEEESRKLKDDYDHIMAQLCLMAKWPEKWRPKQSSP